MVTFDAPGSYIKTKSHLEKLLEKVQWGWLDKYGKKGVEALKMATPIDTGLARNSWNYVIERDNNGNASLIWTNNDIEGGCNVIILLEYGHGTKSGTYVEARPFVQQAIQPIYNEILKEMGKEMG